MKKSIFAIATAALCVLGAPRAHAQYIVFDPTLQIQSIIDTAQEVAQFVTMVENQVTQIQTLTEQLNEFKHYEDLFGDPKAVVVPTIAPLVNDLEHSELGQSLGVIEQTADGAAALTYNAEGLYHTIGATFTTPRGGTVARNTNDFRPFAAINAATANYQTVSTNAATRRTQLKAEIATTIEQLRSATTDAEVQKLSGVLAGLSAALASTEHETSEALGNTLVQDIENRNDERKQAQALKEQQSAAFSEAISNYAKTFQLLDAPTTFPQ
jgi:hypothetical protein